MTRGLLGSLKTGGVSHAYLFTGPRGSGKTTTARLLAKAVNCRQPSDGEPCNECEPCAMANEGRFLDLVELDAASNRGIDEVRQLREQVAFSPSMGKYKTYILDEVHMLTKDAANAFLKTLEEPPAHVLFVLATTEAHKVMATIASRCQRYDFQRIPAAAARHRIEQVLAAEAIRDVSPEAADEIVRRGDGSLRDMLGLLEQVLSMKAPPISLDDVRRALGLARGEQVERLGAAMESRDAGGVLAVLGELHEQGIEPHSVLGQLTEVFRERLAALVRTDKPGAGGIPTERMIAILSRLSALAPVLKQALSPRLTLEIGLLDASWAETIGGREALEKRLDALAASVASLEAALAAGGGVRAVAPERTAAPPGEAPAARGTAEAALSAASPPPLPAAPGPGAAPAAGPRAVELGELPETSALPPEEPPPAGGSDAWQRVLEQLRREKPQTAAFAKEARALPLEGKKLRLIFGKQFMFHRTRLGEPEHKALLGKAVKEQYGPTVTVSIEEDASSPGKAMAQPLPSGDWARQAAEQDKTVQLILETFSGSVVRLE